jgi:transcription elongation factor GreB
MSKAFTRESDDATDDLDAFTDEDEAEGAASSSAGTKNYMTPQGEKRLRDELHELLHVERPKVVETVAWAASNGRPAVCIRDRCNDIECR